jgi:hypothetical protein
MLLSFFRAISSLAQFHLGPGGEREADFGSGAARSAAHVLQSRSKHRERDVDSQEGTPHGRTTPSLGRAEVGPGPRYVQRRASSHTESGEAGPSSELQRGRNSNPRPSGYELDPGGRLDDVELGFKRFPRDRTTWRSAGICGACCPICCPTTSFHRQARVVP